jgi:hypothetical protein
VQPHEPGQREDLEPFQPLSRVPEDHDLFVAARPDGLHEAAVEPELVDQWRWNVGYAAATTMASKGARSGTPAAAVT